MSENGNLRNFTKKNQTLWEFIKFTLMSGVTTIVDMGVFALLNYWLFAGYKTVGFSWWLFNYRVENGGLTALFLASLLSRSIISCIEALSQIITPVFFNKFIF